MSSKSTKGRSGLPDGFPLSFRLLPDIFPSSAGYNGTGAMRGAGEPARPSPDIRICLRKSEVNMETYGEIVWELVDWLTNRSGAILVLSAALPLALLLREGRLVACGVVGVFVGAVMLIVFDIERTVAAVLVILASSLLFSAVLLSTRK